MALGLLLLCQLAEAGVWQRINDAVREKARKKSAKTKPRARPSSTLRALKWLTNPENAALMLERR
jgi:hypothetical protein